MAELRRISANEMCLHLIMKFRSARTIALCIYLQSECNEKFYKDIKTKGKQWKLMEDFELWYEIYLPDHSSKVQELLLRTFTYCSA